MGQWGIGTLLTDTLILSEPETLLLLQTDRDTQILPEPEPQLDMKCEI